MRISVILSTFNQPAWLTKTLWGYAHQSFRPLEIVVADDGSTDDTREVIDRARRDSRLEIRHVWQEDRGFRKTRVLNKAIAASRGDYLIFSDGDCVPRRDFVAAHGRLARPACYLSGGLVRLPMHTSQRITLDDIAQGRCFSPRWVGSQGGMRRSKLLKLAIPPLAADWSNRLTHVLPHFSGCNASCWRADAVRVGGFDERMQYWREDFEFGERLKHAGVRPRQARYSVICLHLDHARGYVSRAMINRNIAMWKETIAQRRVVTEHGLRPAA